MNIINHLLAKLFSARFLVTVLVCSTLCWAVRECFYLVETSLKQGDKELLAFTEKIFMFVLGSFISVVSASVTSYFNRSDRWKKEGEENGTV